MRPLIKTVAALALLALALGGAWLLHATRVTPTPTEIAERRWPVRAVTVTPDTLQPEITIHGEIVAGRTARIRPLVPGTLIAVAPDFVDGGTVRAGQPLFQIDPFDYQTDLDSARTELRETRARIAELDAQRTGEQALLATARARIALREAELARQERLRGRGNAAQASVDQAELSLLEARAEMQGREQTLARLGHQIAREQAALARQELTLARRAREQAETRFYAPFNGFLAETDIARGREVSTADTLGRLIDAGRLEARLQMNESDFARLVAGAAEGEGQGLIGRPVTVRWQTGAGQMGEEEGQSQGLSWQGRLVRQQAEIRAASGMVAVYARLEGVDADSPLRPVAFVEGVLADRRYENAFRLPRPAVDPAGVAYEIGADGRLRRRELTVLRRLGDTVVARGDVAPGTRFVRDLFPEIGPGLKVEIRGDDEDADAGRGAG